MRIIFDMRFLFDAYEYDTDDLNLKIFLNNFHFYNKRLYKFHNCLNRLILIFLNVLLLYNHYQGLVLTDLNHLIILHLNLFL